MTTESSHPRPRVLLADDQEANLKRLGALLETAFDVVATVENGQALVEAAAQISHDAIVTDVSMPILDGIEAARRILHHNPSARVVFVTFHADPSLIRKGLAVGGLGYVPKLAAGEELVPAVWAALRGERWCLCNS